MTLRKGIAILGGTFDPIHFGHLALAKAAWVQLPIARILFVPAGQPWQKGSTSPAHHRLAMLEAALSEWGNDAFAIDPMELYREGPSYTIDTLEVLREKMGPSLPLTLLMGADQWVNLNTWHRWEEILKFANIAVANRTLEHPVPIQAQEALFENCRIEPTDLAQHPFGHITTFSMPPHKASSTHIRLTLAQSSFSEALEQLGDSLPTSVANYIREHRLYGVQLHSKD